MERGGGLSWRGCAHQGVQAPDGCFQAGQVLGRVEKMVRGPDHRVHTGLRQPVVLCSQTRQQALGQW